MGMVRPSMYNAFGDKEALFMRCMARYAQTVPSEARCVLEGSDSIEAGVYGYLKAVAEYSTCHESHRGCLLGSVASVVDDPKIRDFVASVFAATEERFKKRFEAAVDSGELPNAFPVESRARRLMNAMIAIAVRARLGASIEDLVQDAKEGTLIVLAPA